ncbi:hypothetical protein [Kribbella sp. CA-294648]
MADQAGGNGIRGALAIRCSSQDRNQRLTAVARHFMATGNLPG